MEIGFKNLELPKTKKLLNISQFSVGTGIRFLGEGFFTMTLIFSDKTDSTVYGIEMDSSDDYSISIMDFKENITYILNDEKELEELMEFYRERSKFHLGKADIPTVNDECKNITDLFHHITGLDYRNNFPK